MFLAGEPASWDGLKITADELLALCEKEELVPLVYERLSRGGSADEWPPQLRESITAGARRFATEEALRGAEARTVLAALAGQGVQPILIKGTALAYTMYGAPAARPRHDTDLLVAAGDVETTRQAFSSLGYTATLYCHDLFSQFEVQKVDAFGVLHAFDVHWKISTQPVFADLLTYEELLPRAVPVTGLCRAAIAPRTVDALLLACFHPVMHHRNDTRALWVYDVHLLASHLARGELDEFVQLARRKKVAAICARALQQSQTTFGTCLPPGLIDALSAAGHAEPSSEYLASERRWHHELGSSLRGTPSFGGRARLLRQVLLPSPRYILEAYGLGRTPLASCLLPVLYIHRNLRGLWKVVRGKK